MGRSLFITVVTALLVVSAYEVFLRLANPQVEIGQDQFSTNRIRLENYVDRGHQAAAVVLGSSLTARIPDDAWPTGWQVLSQAGGNALVGLDVVEGGQARPKAVLIEINTLDTAYDKGEASAAVGWGGRTARRLLWFTRTANRPANLLIWSVRPRSGSGNERPGTGFSVQLARHQENYAKGAEPKLMENLRLAKLKVESLRRAGVAVAFFEMPVDPSLANLARARQVRRAVAATFPPGSYCWRAAIGAGGARTMDGIHLVPQDGRTAAAVIASGRCVATGRHP